MAEQNNSTFIFQYPSEEEERIYQNSIIFDYLTIGGVFDSYIQDRHWGRFSKTEDGAALILDGSYAIYPQDEVISKGEIRVKFELTLEAEAIFL